MTILSDKNRTLCFENTLIGHESDIYFGNIWQYLAILFVKENSHEPTILASLWLFYYVCVLEDSNPRPFGP